MIHAKIKTGAAAGVFLAAFALMMAGCAATKHNIPPEVRETLFKEADQAMAAAKEKEARKWAPETYRDAEEHYKSAKEALTGGKSLNTIRTRLSDATDTFNESRRIAEAAVVVFQPVIEARADALKAEADTHDSNNYLEGERIFAEAVEHLESGDEVDAKKAAAQAGQYFRSAELYAIKVRILSGAWAILEKADEMEVAEEAPATLQLARKLAAESEERIESNRYETLKAEELAARAEYETAHAIYLCERIRDLKDRKVSYEHILKDAELPLSQIGDQLGFDLKFDEGLAPPAQTIADGIEKMRLENDQLTQEVIDLEARLTKAEQKAEKAVEEAPPEEGAAEKEKIAKEELIREKVSAINNGFSADELMVFENKDEHIVITLVGLTFEAGKSEIDPQYFPLLKRVASALSGFPYQKLIIQGHTDTRGSFAKNLQLSYERAVAVKTYFVDETRISSNKIETSGFGESLPIADNETRKGRKKNRRIEIVIVPEK